MRVDSGGGVVRYAGPRSDCIFERAVYLKFIPVLHKMHAVMPLGNT